MRNNQNHAGALRHLVVKKIVSVPPW